MGYDGDQVGARFVSKVQKHGALRFGTAMPRALNSLDEYGNTASTAHFVVLYDHLRKKAIGPGTKLLMVPAAWSDALTVQVGDFDTWVASRRSDHVPLIVEVKDDVAVA